MTISIEEQSYCASCAEGDPPRQCTKSQKIECYHHCNHIWTHECCCWCGVEETSEDE